MQSISKTIVAATLVSLSLLSGEILTGCAVKQQQETVGQYVDGSVTTTTIKSKILADKKLRNTSISVKTYQNTVQLSGFVNNIYQKAHAEEIAMQVEGVSKVDNAIIIKN